MLSQINLNLLFLSVLILFIGCQSDIEKCEEIQHMGDFFLLEESKSFLPYKEEHSKVIFSDSIGNEYEGIINRNSINSGTVFSTASEPCPFDPTITLKHQFDSEKKVVKIIFQELNLVFTCRIDVNVMTEYNNSKETCDELTVYITDNNDSNILSSMSVNIANRNGFIPSFSTSIFSEDFEIHGKNYKNVYSHNNDYFGEIDYSLFYSKSEGVIAIASLKNSDYSYKFERIE